MDSTPLAKMRAFRAHGIPIKVIDLDYDRGPWMPSRERTVLHTEEMGGDAVYDAPLAETRRICTVMLSGPPRCRAS